MVATKSVATNISSASILLGAMLLGGASKAEDPISADQNSGTAVLTPLRITASALHNREGKLRKVLMPAVAGVELVAGSKAESLLNELAPTWNRGAKAPAEGVAQLFKILQAEPGSGVEPVRVRSLLAVHPESSVRLEILKYLYGDPMIDVSDATLSQFLSSTDAEVLQYALLCRSKRIGDAAPKGYFDRFEHHQSSTVRGACAIAMISAALPPPKISAFESFECTRMLTIEHLAAGHEVRLSKILIERLIAAGHLQSSKELDPHELALPLTHLLQRIDSGYPGYLSRVNTSGHDNFEKLCSGLVKMIEAKRQLVVDREIVSKGGEGLVALHYESDFTSVSPRTLLQSVGAKDVKVVKAGDTPKMLPHVNASSARVILNSPQRQKYLTKLNSERSPEPKSVYLEQLVERAKDTTRPLLVWHLMHGGPDHSWFYHGLAGEDKSDELRTPGGVSHLEMSEALFKSWDPKTEKIELGHITFFLDACRQYTVAEGVLCHLETMAQRANVSIGSYPGFVVLSQPFMYGSLFVNDVWEMPDSPSDTSVPSGGVLVGETLVSPMVKSLVDAAKKNGRVTFGDSIAADQFAAKAFTEQLSDPKCLKALNDAPKRAGSTGGVAVVPINTQNPVIFSPLPVDIHAEVESIIEKIRVEDPSCPEMPLREKGRGASFLEVSESTVSEEMVRRGKLLPQPGPVQKRVSGAG
jgi:hypothetical protein